MIIQGYFFLSLNENICCGYSFESSQQDGSNEYPQHMLSLKDTENYPSVISNLLLLSGLLTGKAVS